MDSNSEYFSTLSRFSDERQIVERTTVFDPNAFFTDINNTKVWFGDEVFAQRTFIRRTVSKVSENHLNIPLGMKFEFLQKVNFSLSIDAALLLQLRKRYSGMILSNTISLLEVEDQNLANLVNTDLSLSYQLGLQAVYNTNANLNYFLSPQFIFNASNVLNENILVKISRRNIGVRFGMRYNF